jgi:tripartite-type tricarboxylate transporter receptor subunit TctC
LNKEINLALKDPGMIAKLKELGGTPIPGTPEDFGKLVADETAKWEKVVRAADLSVN